MAAVMRAKFYVMGVEEHKGVFGTGQEPEKTSETLTLCAVGSGKPYNDDGSGDEDSTFSRWTPQANLSMVVQNPDLWGQVKAGDKFYVDFTRAED
jgi:hypothetical protein